jgi:RNase P/RNase MRP subunit p29
LLNALKTRQKQLLASSFLTALLKNQIKAKFWLLVLARRTTKAKGVKVGDRVLFGKYSGQTVKVDGDELLVMKEEDLFAVVEK